MPQTRPDGVISFSMFSAWANRNGVDGWYWVDAYDAEGDGSYVQLHTGLNLPYLNWQTGEPNYVWSDKCVLVLVAQGEWMNDMCTRYAYVICEY